MIELKKGNYDDNGSQEGSILLRQPRKFDFPVDKLPILSQICILRISELRDVKYLSNGSNSYTYTSTWLKNKIVIKMLKPKLPNVMVATKEIGAEIFSLSRMSHPNIVRILAYGNAPRSFIALEYLGGGTLDTILSAASFSRTATGSTLSLHHLLKIAFELLFALQYLHYEFSPFATVIHRGKSLQYSQLYYTIFFI